jgi:hypothetical protein
MGGVSCRTCGLVNPPGRTFCQRCGQELDPAVGTVAGAPRPVARASSGSGGRRLAAVGLALVAIAVIAAGALLFGGFLGNPSPTATLTAIGSPSVAPVTTDRPGTTHQPTDRPTPRPTRRVTIAPTEEPATGPTEVPTDGPAPTVGGPTPAAPGTFECDQSAAIQDPRSEGWRIQGVNWANTGATDRVVVTLNRFQPLAGEATQAIVHVRPVSEIADTLKVVPPSAGRDAVALSAGPPSLAAAPTPAPRGSPRSPPGRRPGRRVSPRSSCAAPRCHGAAGTRSPGRLRWHRS